MFLGASPQASSLICYNYRTNILNIVFLEKDLKTTMYPCGGTYIYYVDVPSQEAFPLCPRYTQASLHPRYTQPSVALSLLKELQQQYLLSAVLENSIACR